MLHLTTNIKRDIIIERAALLFLGIPWDSLVALGISRYSFIVLGIPW